MGDNRANTGDSAGKGGGVAPSDAVPGKKPPNWIERKLNGFYVTRDSIRAHPLWGSLFALVVFLAGILGSLVYDFGINKLMGPDEFLARIAETQKQEFAALKENLSQLKSSIDADDREAFQSVQSAVDSLEEANTGLIQQLVLAKRENETLRKQVKERTGVAGGYDLILSEGSGIRLDESTILGLNDVGSQRSYETYVTLTSSDAEQARKQHLSAGESLNYTNAAGKACKLSLLSSNDAKIGSASFAISCKT